MSDATGVVFRRYVQYAVDRVLSVVGPVVVVVIALFFMALTEPGSGGRRAVAYTTAVLFVASMLAGNWFIEVWVPSRWLGGTPGMRWLGLRVLTDRGGDPSMRTYLIRWLMMIVDGYVFGLVGALAIAFSPQHQRFGDMVARTVVVRRDAGGEPRS